MSCFMAQIGYCSICFCCMKHQKSVKFNATNFSMKFLRTRQERKRKSDLQLQQITWSNLVGFQQDHCLLERAQTRNHRSRKIKRVCELGQSYLQYAICHSPFAICNLLSAICCVCHLLYRINKFLAFYQRKIFPIFKGIIIIIYRYFECVFWKHLILMIVLFHSAVSNDRIKRDEVWLNLAS